MKAILGIDPGMEGGLAIRGRDWVVVEPMPVIDKDLDLQEISIWLRAHSDEIEFCFIEKPGIRLKQSITTCAKQWLVFGELVGIIASLAIPYQIIDPRVWSAEFEHGVTVKAGKERYRAIKVARKGIAARLFPGVDLRENARCKVAHEGMTDALLLAEWGYRQRTKGNA